MGQINKYGAFKGRDALKMPQNRSTHYDAVTDRQIKVPIGNVDEFLENLKGEKVYARYDRKLADILGRLGYSLSVEQYNWIDDELKKDNSRMNLLVVLGRMGCHLSIEEADRILDAIAQ